ncbi:MAG: cupin protein [Bacteroidota bacterium]|jgi:uncharacterized protein YjlB|nr:cupin protein [Bacteroidota bacterium]
MKAVIKRPVIKHFFLKDDGTFPNNGKLPVLLYKSAWQLPLFRVTFIKSELRSHFWENSWRNGVHEYHHYHSTAHEVLCAYKGETKLLLGGNNGVIVDFSAGDVLIIPAGVAHKNIQPDNPLKCVGAYPKGQNYDMNYGEDKERPAADNNIKNVSLPLADPIFGKDGPLMDYWHKR